MNRHTLTTVFNGLGYVSVYIQLMCPMALAMPAIVRSGVLVQPTLETAPTPPAPTTIPFAEPVTSMVAVVAVVLCLAFMLYAFKKSAQITSQAGDKTVKKTVELLLPAVTHHKKLSQKRRYQLSQTLQLVVRLTMSLVAFLSIFLTCFIELPLERSLAYWIALFLMPWSLLWFLIAHLLRPKKSA